MKRKLAIVLFFLTFSNYSTGQFVTPGTGVSWDLEDLVFQSEGNITQSGGHFYFNNNLLISELDTILFDVNTVIFFDPDVLVTVQGILFILPPDSILLTATDTLQPFRSFKFENSDASTIQRCTIEYGGGIDLLNSDITIQDCIFRNNSQINTPGTLDLFFSSPIIKNNQFISNSGPAILSAANGESSPQIINNIMIRNTASNANMPQINLGTSAPGTTILIKNNTIEGFYTNSGGIAVATLAGGEIECVIDSNIIYNNRYGITIYGFDINSTISSNLIYDNNIQNQPMQGGSGINIWGGLSNSCSIVKNEIYGNLWGITNTGDALPNIGEVEPDTINPGQNKIYENGNFGTEYALYNNTPNNIKAENNYWGYSDPDSVEQVIFHFPDDESLGFVDYEPYEDSIITYSTAVEKTTLIHLFPNPVQNYFYIDNPGIIHRHGRYDISVYNASGYQVYTGIIESFPVKLDINSWPPGVYILEMNTGEHIFKDKFVKQ